MGILSFFQILAKPIFGTFDQEEFKKFLRLGLVFACVLGSYWALRTLKYAVFCPLVGASEIPYAKIVSLICLFPLVMGYSILLDKLNKRYMFYIIAGALALCTVLFAGLLVTESIGQASCEVINARKGIYAIGTKILGYAWYVFVESYGSLLVALFWAIVVDTTKPASAKQGFYLVTALGQIGGILAPITVSKLPRLVGLTTNSLAIASCALITIGAIMSIRNFFNKTPNELLLSYRADDQSTKVSKENKTNKKEPGFAEGLLLLLRNNYLLGIFAVLAFFEFIVTIFDLHFQVLASTKYSGIQLTEYLGLYGTAVNFVSLACLLLGVSNITKFFGLRASLALMPIIITIAITGFITFGHLNFLFAVMVASKALQYALNKPSIQQLYIPTTNDVRFKAQAWIETFGSRGSKGIGSGFNMLLKPLQKHMGMAAGRLQHVMLGSYLGYSLVIIWFFIALFLGNTYKKAIDNKEVVC